MSHRLRFFAAMIVSCLALLASSTASAGPVISMDTDAKGGVGNLSNIAFTFNGVAETGLAGTFATIFPGGVTADTYCVDLFHNTPVGTGGTVWSAEVLPLDGSQGAPTVSNFAALANLYATNASQVTTAIQGAALQVAIWKSEYDPANTPLNAGNFQFADTPSQDAIYKQVSLYLNSPVINSGSGVDEFRATSHPNFQNQDLIGPSSFNNFDGTVPEPASMVMVSLGLAGVLGAARRRKRSSL